MKKAYLETGNSGTVYLYVPGESGQNAPLLFLEAVSIYSLKINEVTKLDIEGRGMLLRIHINEEILILQKIKNYINSNL